MASQRKSKIRANFTKAMTQWFQSMKYMVGVPTTDVDVAKELTTTKKFVHTAMTLLGSSMPISLSGGASSEKLFYALVPFMQFADIIGTKVEWGSTIILPVIYADPLTPMEIEHRFEQFLTLGKSLTAMGIRMNGQGFGAYISPLLVYFEKKKYEVNVPLLKPKRVKSNFWTKVYVKAYFINVPDKSVDPPERNAVAAFVTSMGESFGMKGDYFEKKDLEAILTLANL